MRRGRHQEEVVGHLGELLAELVGEGLLVAGVGAHLVGLVHDDEVPAGAEQAFVGVFDPGDPGDRRDDLVVVLPGVLAVVGAEDVAADDLEVLAELVLHLALPLEREVGRRDDERALDQPAGLQLLEQQPGHDGFAGAGVVGQEEADARELEEVVVDRFELMGQRINAGDGEREVRVVLVGEPEPVRLDAEAEVLGGTVEGFRLAGDLELGDLLRAQDRVVAAAGLRASADDFERRSERDDGEHFHRFRDERPADGDALPYLIRRRGGDGHFEVAYCCNR